MQPRKFWGKLLSAHRQSAKDTAKTEKLCLLPFSHKLEINLNKISSLLGNPEDLIVRTLAVDQEPELKVALVRLDGLVDEQTIYQTLLEPLMSLAPESARKQDEKNWLQFLKNHVLTAIDLSFGSHLFPAIEAILSGKTILLIEGYDQVLLVDTRKWGKKGI